MSTRTIWPRTVETCTFTFLHIQLCTFHPLQPSIRCNPLSWRRRGPSCFSEHVSSFLHKTHLSRSLGLEGLGDFTFLRNERSTVLSFLHRNSSVIVSPSSDSRGPAHLGLFEFFPWVNVFWPLKNAKRGPLADGQRWTIQADPSATDSKGACFHWPRKGKPPNKGTH